MNSRFSQFSTRFLGRISLSDYPVICLLLAMGLMVVPTTVPKGLVTVAYWAGNESDSTPDSDPVEDGSPGEDLELNDAIARYVGRIGRTKVIHFFAHRADVMRCRGTQLRAAPARHGGMSEHFSQNATGPALLC